MDRDSFGRSERRALRELAGTAWKRELALELRRLGESFDAWRDGDLGPHELSDRIHQFHHGAARKLYGLYTCAHPSQLVARAVAHGLVSESEVSAALYAKLGKAVEFYRSEQSLLESDERDEVSGSES